MGYAIGGIAALFMLIYASVASRNLGTPSIQSPTSLFALAVRGRSRVPSEDRPSTDPTKWGFFAVRTDEKAVVIETNAGPLQAHRDRHGRTRKGGLHVEGSLGRAMSSS